MEDSKSNKFVVPISIILAGIIIGGAIYYDRKSANPSEQNPSQNQAASPSASPLDNLNPITESDHIMGNPSAPVSIILFSDLECSFCKRFHVTMKQIMDEYGKNGQVKWIFRHLPLDIHPKSKNEAVASECATELGGNDSFWKYIDRVFEVTPSNNGLDPAELPKIAKYIGLDQTKFTACLSNASKFDQKINDNADDGIKSGAQGTPYAVVIGPNGQKTAIPGALPYEDVKKIIDDMLAKK